MAVSALDPLHRGIQVLASILVRKEALGDA